MTDTGVKSQAEPGEATTGAQPDCVKVRDLHRIFAWNVVTLAVLGTAVYAWADYFTDRLPAIITLVGGGGALAWVTTAAGFFKSERKDQLINWAETTIFTQRAFSLLLLLTIIVLSVSATQFGAVQVQSLPEESEHSVKIWREGEPQPDDFARLAPSEHVRRVVWTPFATKRKVHIWVRGFPDKVVEVLPMQRVPVYVPNSVRTPVVLVHPTIRLMDAAHTDDGTALFRLELESKDSSGNTIQRSIEFDGQHSILIGGDEEIAIPSETMDEWRAEADKRLDAIRAWRALIAPQEFSIALTQGQDLLLTLRQAQCPPDTAKGDPPAKCQVYNGPVPYKVKALHGSQPFIQEVQLDTPSNK
jgi:hypothetical protein